MPKWRAGLQGVGKGARERLEKKKLGAILHSCHQASSRRRWDSVTSLEQLPTNVWSGIKYAEVTTSCSPAFQGLSLKMQQGSYRPSRSYVLSRYEGERQVHKMSRTISICVYYANPLSNLSMHVCTKDHWEFRGKKGPLRVRGETAREEQRSRETCVREVESRHCAGNWLLWGEEKEEEMQD